MASTIAKLSSPRAMRGLVKRERLHRLLDEACTEAGCIWIGAGAGYGKTVLAAGWAKSRGRPLFWFDADEGDASAGNFLHYLQLLLPATHRGMREPAPHYTPDGRVPLAVLARAFVRGFYERLPNGAVLVIDDAEQLPAGSEGATVLASLISELPRHVNLVIVSRQPPDPALARTRVAGKLCVLGCEALRLTPDETHALAAARSQGIDVPQARRIHAWSDGWPAGARLLSEGPSPAPLDAAGAHSVGSDALFAYIASELFETWTAEVRHVLLLVAVLPTLSGDVAVRVSDCANAAGVLEDLADKNFFVSRLPGAGGQYKLHPLLRQFLLAIAHEQLGAGGRESAQRRAALALVEAGDTVAAARLWIALQDWRSLAQMLEATGDALLAQGRQGEVLAWLDAMPAALLQADPLLGLWRARALLSCAPAEGVDLLTRLWPELEREAPPARLADAWDAVVCSHLFLRRPQRMAQWAAAADRLVARLAANGDESTQRRALAATFVGFSKIAPERWPDGDEAAIEMACDPLQPADIRLTFGASVHFHYQWRAGALPLPQAGIRALRELCRSGRGSVHQRLVWLWIDVMLLLWFDPDESLRQVEELVRLASALTAEHRIDEFGFPHFVPMMIAAHHGNPGAAAQHVAALRAMPPPPAHALFELPPRMMVLAMYHLYVGNIVAAEDCARRGLAAADEVGSPPQRMMALCAAARAAAARGDLAGAYRLLRRSSAIGRDHQMGAFRCGPWLVASTVALQAGRRAAAGFTRRAMREMAAYGTLRAPQGTLTCRHELEQLCAVAWAHGVERPWVASLVRIRGLQAPSGCGGEDWPWPVSIRTRDGISIERNGQPVSFGRKAPRKVLDLLGVLVEAGPRLLPATHVVDELWPDEDGDAGHRAFLTALHRLRKLVGERAVVHREGRVGLDSGHVHVERAVTDAAVAERRARPSTSNPLPIGDTG